MRDWLSAFLPASFRGVAFKVEGESGDGARRLAIHSIAYSDQSVIEDFGGNPDTFQKTAYLAGDAADIECKALIAALKTKGAGTLVLPMIGPRRCRVGSWSFVRYKDRAGYVAIDIDFIEEGLPAVPFLAAPASASLADGMATIAATIAASFADAVASVRKADLDGVSAAGLEVSDRVGNLAALAPGASGGDLVAAATEALAVSATSIATDPAGFARAAFEALRLVGKHGDADNAFDLVAATLSANSGGIAATVPVAEFERMALTATLSIAAVRKVYSSRSQTRAARDTLSSLADPVLIAVADRFGASAFGWLSETTGQAALDISRVGADRAPLVRVETGESLPATVAAHALYGDANRAADIVARNQVATPALMPAIFEAAAQ